MSENVTIKRALISVSDKTGVEKLARALEERGVEIISTGGTLKVLKKAGIHAISVSTFTGAPEILGGRVKTLHPRVHAGILYRRDNEADVEQMASTDYKGIDLVVASLYPFEQTVANPKSNDKDIIENIDIGGPSMIRAAAKNYESVTVVVAPSDYDRLLEQLKANDGATDLAFRRECAGKAFALTSHYDTSIVDYFTCDRAEPADGFPVRLHRSFARRSRLRYGENPHQQASLYADEQFGGPTLIRAEQLSGKELSYNNYNDLDACLEMLLDFSEPFACVLKHANPCGAAIGKDLAEAYKRAYESDPLSAYGSIIGLNKEIDMEAAQLLHETPFVECILAPSITDEAFKLLKKKKARRILTLPQIADGRPDGEKVYRFIRGGLLVQTADDQDTPQADLKVVSKRAPTKKEMKDLLFGWKVVKHTKSNAIVLAKDGATVGIGMGQTSRVDSGFMAVKRAGERAKGSVMASDAFFPMADGVEVGTNAGVTAIIQPGGSKGDEQAIAAADKAGAAMVFTGMRHFKH
ncbi:MAG: bifunctional phosphoribosylaminoimidazolecarboxamide formyltransferase/IMP cyclohydrolase [Candidatus Zixiibacteriota bacterium]|nr:MAG: bifunctional phosphoribosylaminoimidazolecarboxamide formyltransferase/IMP cyclohydrolase [candidate division Zixibacteria bacterium]